jgi:ABC-type Fe3+/spermidine/putrescine transport system ATPase subunit
MNRGTCVQCDAPEALFRRPRTRFVASFFRGCNVLEGELAGLAGGRAQLRIAGSPADTRAAGGRATGPVGVALRAESVRVAAAAAACEIRLEAALHEVMYRGTNVDHVVTLSDGQRLVATSTRREVDGAATSVAVGFEAADVVVLDD